MSGDYARTLMNAWQALDELGNRDRARGGSHRETYCDFSVAAPPGKSIPVLLGHSDPILTTTQATAQPLRPSFIFTGQMRAKLRNTTISQSTSQVLVNSRSRRASFSERGRTQSRHRGAH